MAICFVLLSVIFLLPRYTPHAQNAAEAAETAGAQGRFWEMHDILYENQDALDDASLREYALMLELDMERFDDEMMKCTRQASQGRFHERRYEWCKWHSNFLS